MSEPDDAGPKVGNFFKSAPSGPAGLDPSLVVGGVFPGSDTVARVGGSDFNQLPAKQKLNLLVQF